MSIVYANRLKNLNDLTIFNLDTDQDPDGPAGNIESVHVAPGLGAVQFSEWHQNYGYGKFGFIGKDAFSFKSDYIALWSVYAVQSQDPLANDIAVQFGINQDGSKPSNSGSKLGCFRLDNLSGTDDLNIMGIDSGYEVLRSVISWDTHYKVALVGSDYNDGTGPMPGSLQYWIKGGPEFPNWTRLGVKQYNLTWADTTAYLYASVRNCSTAGDTGLVQLSRPIILDEARDDIFEKIILG